jgi:hypothetical protein
LYVITNTVIIERHEGPAASRQILCLSVTTNKVIIERHEEPACLS